MAARSDLILLLANLVFATSPVATLLTLDDVPPAMLATVRCAIGFALLAPFAGRGDAASMSVADHVRIAAMGVISFSAAFALSHWGIVRSTASNAALLIIVEPIAIIVLSPVWLGERLQRRELVGSILALTGTALVVVNGIPGLTAHLAPHWRGDLLLFLAGIAFAAYSLIGRDVLRRQRPTSVTALSIGWGALALVPLASYEWWQGARTTWTGTAVLGTAYLGVVITAVGYVVWNWLLERVSAPRAAIFLSVQPVAGALLGVILLKEPFTIFTALGGALIVAGLTLTALPVR